MAENLKNQNNLKFKMAWRRFRVEAVPFPLEVHKKNGKYLHNLQTLFEIYLIYQTSDRLKNQNFKN